MKRIFIILVLTFFIYSSCKKDIPKDTTPALATTAELARDSLYKILNEDYYWYNLMPVVDNKNYNDPYQLMDAMKYKTLDKWSYIQTYIEYLAWAQGTFVGHGVTLVLDAANKTRVGLIYNKSPLYAKGVRRGWIIKSINGTDVAPLLLRHDSVAYKNVIGPAEAGITNTFLFQTPEGKDSTIISTKSSFALNTVLLYDTLHLKSGITGHLVFEEFIPPSNQELKTAFAYFKQNNIKDLIVDLRYNGGGDLTVLTNMASYIAGNAKVNMPFISLKYNDKNTKSNGTFYFNSVSSPLVINKLITICTRLTTSASEDLINGLKPYLDVICIGDTTNGKPVGMNLFEYKTDYMFVPVTFSVENSANQGGFYKGFPPQKYVPDDVTHDFNDRKELCLNEAIYYLEHGSVSPGGKSYIYHRSSVFSEKPAWMNNATVAGK